MVKIMKAITSSPDMRDKKELIENFIASMTPSVEDQDVKDKWYDFLKQVGKQTMLEESQFPYGKEKPKMDVTDLWEIYVQRERERELNAIIEEEKLNPEKTRSLMESAKANGYIETNGTSLISILPPMPLFGAGNKREEKKRIVCEKLEQWLRRYSGC